MQISMLKPAVSQLNSHMQYVVMFCFIRGMKDRVLLSFFQAVAENVDFLVRRVSCVGFKEVSPLLSACILKFRFPSKHVICQSQVTTANQAHQPLF